MPHAHGEIVPNPEGDPPYRVRVKVGDTVLADQPVSSVEAGEALLNDVLAKLREFEHKD